MSYVLQHIFNCLLIAALIGSVVGWLLRQYTLGRRLASQRAEWRRKMEQAVEGERERQGARLREAVAQRESAGARLAALEAEHARLRDEHERLKDAQARIAGEQMQLQAERQRLNAQLAEREAALLQAAARSSSHDGARAKLEADLRDCSHRRSLLQGELAAWTKRAQAAEAECSRLGAELERLTDRGSAAEAAHQARIRQIEAERDALQWQISVAEASARDWEARHGAALQTIEALRREISRVAEQASAGETAAPLPAPRAGEPAPGPAASAPAAGDIERLEGVDAVHGQKLRARGVCWIADLLTVGATPQGRERLAAETGISGKLILKWVNAADLLRIQGLSPDHAELLERAGVDTVAELGRRVAKRLRQKLVEANRKAHRSRQVPPVDTVQRWIDQARALEPRVSY